MRQTLRMPKLDDTTTEVIVSEWYVAAGDRVEAGAGLIRVETDKADVDVTCPVTGLLVERLVGLGDAVETGAPYAVVDD